MIGPGCIRIASPWWLAGVLVALLLGCSGEPEDTIARIGEQPVTAAEFESWLEHRRLRVKDEEHRARLLDQYLEREAMARLIESRQDEDARRAAAAEIADFRRQMLISRYFEERLRAAVDDEKIRNYYLANPERYSEQKVHVAHVLVRLKRGMSEAERGAKLTLINEAYSKLRAGADFAAIADEYSEDQVSAPRGGDLGWLKPGAIDARFSEKMMSLGEGEISEPFETPFGYHVIKVLDAPRTTTRSLESATGDIRYLLRQQAKQALEDELRAGLAIEKVR